MTPEKFKEFIDSLPEPDIDTSNIKHVNVNMGFSDVKFAYKLASFMQQITYTETESFDKI